MRSMYDAHNHTWHPSEFGRDTRAHGTRRGTAVGDVRPARFPVVIAKFWAVSSACENKPGGVSQIVIAVTV